MTIEAKITNALTELADATIQLITEETGQQPNDYTVRDVARSLAMKPCYDAARKRKYIEMTLMNNIKINTVYHEGTDKPLDENDQPLAYHAALMRYQTLGPRLEFEAMALDRAFYCHKEWYHEYTGQELVTSQAKQPANKLTKKQQEVLKKLEAKRVAMGA